MDTETKDREYLTAQELSDRANVHVNTVYRWVEDGAPHRRVGPKGLRFVWSEVDSWLRERTEEST